MLIKLRQFICLINVIIHLPLVLLFETNQQREKMKEREKRVVGEKAPSTSHGWPPTIVGWQPSFTNTNDIGGQLWSWGIFSHFGHEIRRGNKKRKEEKMSMYDSFPPCVLFYTSSSPLSFTLSPWKRSLLTHDQ